jgi:predicted dehydrogenase
MFEEPAMSEGTVSPRREFLKKTAGIAAVSALAGVAIPHVHAGEENAIRLALIGCGGRGSGAVANAMSAGGLVMSNDYRADDEENAKSGGPVQLVAMADLFADRLDSAHANLSKALGKQVDVPKERQFLGFDAYRKAIDCLRPGDIAMLTTHAAFRMTHLEYAIEKGVNVFMEKSFAVDPAGVHKMLQLSEAADKKGLKIGCGLMCRHSSARQAMIQKIRDGAMGNIELIRAYRMDGGWRMGRIRSGKGELEDQIRRATCFLWTSSGFFLEYMIHQIDECCWIKDGYPVSVHGVGGRAQNNDDYSQNLDSYSVEYTFADGTKAFVTGRYIPNCLSDFITYCHGTKCAGQFSGAVHAPTSMIYKDQHTAANNVAWKPKREKINPWQAEWNELLSAIRNNKPYNETKRAAFSQLAAIMGRAAVHTGKMITWDEAMNSKFQFCPNVGGLTMDGPAPVQADANGRYPVPTPGVTVEV